MLSLLDAASGAISNFRVVQTVVFSGGGTASLAFSATERRLARTLEAEAGMLGQPVYFLTPDVVGVNLKGKLHPACTATDLVLTITEMLRKEKVVGKFVEFFGAGTETLSLTDRATIANTSKVYDFFANQTYSDKFLAIVREFVEKQAYGGSGYQKKKGNRNFNENNSRKL
mgnify:CR=1 FL=1